MANVWRRFWTCLAETVAPPLFYPLASWPVPKSISEANLAHNRARDISGALVTSQRAGPAAQMRYARTECRRTGCGALAVYNALTLLGQTPSLSEVIHLLERRRSAACGGRMGTHPYTLGGALRAFGVRTKRFWRVSALEDAMDEGSAAILAIWNDRNDIMRGAHFFAVRRAAEGFTACNREAPNARGASLADVLGQGRLITAYLLRPLA